MNIFVTGGAGYIGGIAAAELLAAGHTVTVYDSLVTGHRRVVPAQAAFVQADLGDEGSLEAALQREPFDAVMHFAAFIEAGESMSDPAKYFHNNLAHSLRLIEAVHRAQVPRFVLSSTAAVYRTSDEPLGEQAPLGPANVYGQTKLMIEQALDWYHKIHGLRYAALRYFNAAGAHQGRGEAHQPESHLIPLVLQVAQGKRPAARIFGDDYPTPDGTCIRDYIHVADLVAAHLLALDSLDRRPRQIYNLGNGAGYSVLQVIEAARHVTGHPLPSLVEPRRPGDPPRLVAAAEKVRLELGWTPRTPDLDAIIASAWEWHQAHPGGYPEDEVASGEKQTAPRSESAQARSPQLMESGASPTAKKNERTSMPYQHTQVPPHGEPIRHTSEGLVVPDRPILPFIEGDGTGPDIWRASVRVFDAAVEKAYAGKRGIAWMEVFAGQKAFDLTGTWLPDETVEAFREFLVGIKGPLTTPVGGGIRSLNVALRKALDLYVCLRPVRYFEGVPSPVKRPQDVDMVIFRENTEDLYTGIEFDAAGEIAGDFKAWLRQSHPKEFAKIRFPDTAGIGVKPISREGTDRLVRAAIRWALANRRKSVTLVHKGNIMKFTEGAFRNWGYDLAEAEFGDRVYTWRKWEATKASAGEEAANAEQRTALESGRLLIKDVIADIAFQQTITRAREFDVIATMNLNGDFLSDALAAQVGGIGIAPGGNINYVTGHAVFEATHGTAPKYADQDLVNPGSVILSGEMMLRYLGWTEAADRIVRGMQGAIDAKTVTYDFDRLMEGATKVRCSEFGDAVIGHM